MTRTYHQFDLAAGEQPAVRTDYRERCSGDSIPVQSSGDKQSFPIRNRIVAGPPGYQPRLDGGFRS